jgi:phosphoesterase RecJ-like protein
MANLQPTVEFLSRAPGAVLLTHERPDGDALGSVAGLAHWFQSGGRPAEIWLYAPPPERYAHLLRDLIWRVLEPGARPPQRDWPWVVADTCSYNQLTPVAEAIRARGGADWAIDHHLTRDPLYKGALIDESAAATGLLVYEIVRAAGHVPHAAAAEAIFTAICTDTGWFRFSNADARTFRAAAGLIDAGAKVAETYERLYQNDAPSRMALVAEALSGMELHENGAVAVLTLTQESFRRSGATSADTEGLTDEAGRLRGVNVVLLFVEMNDGKVRCSLRSKRDVDVNKVAARFGGGGHARASGARIPGSPAEVKPMVISAVVEALRAAR